MSSARRPQGTLALVGGGEWSDPCRELDTALLAASDASEVLVLPTAAAYEHPERAVERAAEWFRGLGAKVEGAAVLNRRDTECEDVLRAVRVSRFIYVADGSPLHLRSVLKGSELWDAMLDAYRGGAVLAASGAGATVICDPMVDPRGGAYTVGLGVVTGLAVFPYHGTAADHLRERSIELMPRDAILAGVDEQTALVRDPSGTWRAIGPGVVTLYARGTKPKTAHDAEIPTLTM